MKHLASGDKAIEGDGANSNGNIAGFVSKPTITNFTAVGEGSANSSEAIRLRVGTQGIFTNFKITGYGEGFDLDDIDTGSGVVSDNLQVTNVTFEDITIKVKNDTGVSFTNADFYTGEGTATGTDYTTWGANWTVE